MMDLLRQTVPLQGSPWAVSWDNLYFFLVGISIFFFFVVLTPMIYFAIRYRASKGHKPAYITHHHLLEIVWTAIPTILLMVIFAWGWFVYKDLLTAPKGAIEVRVVAQSWSWKFQYDDGRVSDYLFVPVNQPVALSITAQQSDVLHSFFVPTLRIKKDAVPGAFSHIWFTATVPGQHQIFCAEYCGTGHSAMLSKMVVLDGESWKLWKWGKEVPLPSAVGIGSAPRAKIP